MVDIVDVLRVGDRVRVTKCSECPSKQVNFVAIVNSLFDTGSFYSENFAQCGHRYWSSRAGDGLELITGSFENLQVDDVLVLGGAEQTVLARTGKAIALSSTADVDVLEGWYTVTELERNGFQLKNTVDMVELTLEDIAELKGVPVDRIRIKEAE